MNYGNYTGTSKVAQMMSFMAANADDKHDAEYQIFEGYGAIPVAANDNWPAGVNRGPSGVVTRPPKPPAIHRGKQWPQPAYVYAPNPPAAATADDDLPGRQGRYIRTASGRRFYPHDPRPEDIFPEDIAHSLARIQRYGGHASRTYSVAEHCCLGSDYLLERAGAMFAFAFLLHDATEALGFGDVPAPTKAGLPDYKAAEARVAGAVDRRFLGRYAGQGWLSCWMVKATDARITTDEMVQVMSGREPGMPEPIGVTLENWPAWMAQCEWTARFERLYRRVHGEEWRG